MTTKCGARARDDSKSYLVAKSYLEDLESDLKKSSMKSKARQNLQATVEKAFMSIKSNDG